MSIAQAAPAVNLREIAARALTEQREAAERALAEELTRRQTALLNDAARAIEAAFCTAPQDGPAVQVDPTHARSATYSVHTTDSRVPERTDLWYVQIGFMGEQFVYRLRAGNPQSALYHREACKTGLCWQESHYPISSLVDLAEWLAERAPCACEGGAS